MITQKNWEFCYWCIFKRFEIFVMSINGK